MARRRSKQPAVHAGQSRSERAFTETAFNNPFAVTARAIKSQLAKRKKRAFDRRIAAETHGGDADRAPSDLVTNSTAEDGADESPLRFEDVVRGVVPIDRGAARIAMRPVADLESIEQARQAAADAELVEMVELKNFDIRYSDQYIRGSSEGVSLDTIRKLECGEFAVRGHLDLHGMVVEDATAEVDRFLTDCHSRGFRCVLIITGKGKNSVRQTGVLREAIPHWLARGPSSRLVLAFVTARPCDGGSGAIYVLLRNRLGRKSRIDVVTGGIGD